MKIPSPRNQNVDGRRRRSSDPREGVVLLIVLGMLSLFTILTVSYVVFSSQMAESSYASQERRLSELLPGTPLESAMLQLVVGTDDPGSAAFGGSLFEDFYGVDGYQMRVANRRGPVSDGRTPPAIAGSQLLLPVPPATGTPQTTLFKFPSHLVWWHNDGDPTLVLPIQAPIPIQDLATDLLRQRTEVSAELDDALSGRIIAFQEGPLRHVPFRIIRSFGTDNGTLDRGVNIDNAAEYSLAGNLVIDLSEFGSETITINGVSESLYDVANRSPNQLVYSPGPDGRAGTPGNPTLGAPGSDDVGFRFVVNGAVFNGRGLNPAGVTGVRRDIRRTNTDLDSNAEIEFTLNARLTGANYGGGNDTNAEYPEPDEAWDAPDMENIFLAWQPSDHRRSFAQSIYTGAEAAELNRQLGQHIIPSFHRPAIINYLMNAPIWLPGETRDPNNPAPTFAQIPNPPTNPGDYPRLLALAIRLRRATLRPLNFPHVSGLGNDLNADGDPFDGTPLFNGSNPVGFLNQPINLGAATIKGEITRLATWLVNGPWDVDNDGDGLPDSVWIDLNLPTVTSPDGQVIKPMVAALIEDWDGKINVNYQGGFNQLVNRRFPFAPANYTSDPEYFQTTTALGSIKRGGGLGPAELDFSHLFAFDFSPPSSLPAGFVGPVATNQTGQSITIDQVLATRYGNLLNARYGGRVYNYASPYPYQIPAPPATISPLANFLRFPGAGTRYNLNGNADLLARIPFPSRVFNHQADSFAGRPVDISGLIQTGKNFSTGSHGFNRLPAGDEIINQPYEFGATEIRGDDQPFSSAEHVDFLNGGALNSRLSQLLGDAADRNKALRHLVAPESRSVDSPEIPGERGFVQFMARKIGNVIAPETKNFHLHRMLAVELRKGSKLNLNRQIGNEQDDNANGLGDEETGETGTFYGGPTNTANNRRSFETAFPQIAPDYQAQSLLGFAHYNQNSMIPNIPGNTPLDFDGIDIPDNNGDLDGVLDVGTPLPVDIDGNGIANDIPKMADGAELLARHLYCLMFALIENESGGVLVPDFPYPDNFDSSALPPVKNAYVARRLAQWSANAVDFRDVDAKCTRLRYDPNPFDGGFQLVPAASNTVWGMERPEIEISEAIAFHDKRLKRNLDTSLNNVDADTELTEDEDDDATMDPDPDKDMDQFRIPQASAYVELHSLRSPSETRIDSSGNVFIGETQESLPSELYTLGPQGYALDLGKVAGANPNDPFDPAWSPVWRLAVGQPTNREINLSTRWVFDAERLETLSNRPGELDYLELTVADWTTQLANWNRGIGVSAEIRDESSRNDGARVSIAGFDNVVSPSSADHRIQLERFVLFRNVRRTDVEQLALIAQNPNPPVPRIFDRNGSGNASGMNFENTFFNFPDRFNANDATLPMNAAARLLPGGYAVIAPRPETIFGQTSESNAVNGYEYHPVRQRLQFSHQGAGRFRLNYFGLLSNAPLTPRYFEDRTATDDFHQAAVLPLICESLLPHEVAGGSADWQNYMNNVSSDPANNPNGLAVDMGFNISAPLTGAGYYPAPTDRISPNGSDPITGLAGYPFRDGYRGYDPAANASTNLHRDTPFDHDATSLMDQVESVDNVGPPPGITLTWNAIGTHQEARTVFLQRLADPTVAWHSVDNPYLTVDFCPVDLTTMNGEEDPAQPIDYAGDGDSAGPEADPNGNLYVADWNKSFFNGAFTPEVKLDSRRKIPNVQQDRPASRLVPTTNPPNTLARHQRQVATHRSPMSASFSVLRPSFREAGQVPAASGFVARWKYELGSLWVSDTGQQDQTRTEQDDIVDQIDSRYSPTPSLDRVPPDLATLRTARTFRQTLGFVNREYGFPVLWTSDVNSTTNPRLADVRTGVSLADGVLMSSVPWMDREFQSNYDVINVPAVSRTGLLPTFSTGTDPNATTPNFEIAVGFTHLLGFGDKYSKYRMADVTNSAPLGVIIDGNGDYEDQVDAFTGDRAGFEQIFDYIDVGPVWFDSQRWFDPSRIQFRSGDLTTLSTQAQMFNRTVETLQPPYNYIGRHRTPGKVNLNTTPDYIRKGPDFNDPDDPDPVSNPNPNQLVVGRQFLDAYEAPENPGGANGNANFISSDASNFPVNGNGFTAQFLGRQANPSEPSQLFGNGSVYRSFAYGISTSYELDTTYGSPRTMGQPDLYQQSVDTSFGRGFKAFIESRRGYSSSFRGAGLRDPSTGVFNVNPNLDSRYPTRFAGLFGPARASSTPSVQRLMRQFDPQSNDSRPRRTHDMGMIRPHPDFDERTLDGAGRTAALSGNLGAANTFSLRVEAEPTGGTVTVPTLQPAGSTVRGLEMSMLNTGLFERPQADLHKSFRNLDRDSYFRFQDVSRLSGVTTHHSNVFHIRLTLGYFVVDPTTGAVGREYINQTGDPIRNRANYVVDRTIPVGYIRGRNLGAERAVIYSEVEE